MELIRLENICKTYFLGEVQVPVLRGVSLSIQRGELVALMGASGSGKTTLMNLLGCLDRPTDGEYWLDGQQMSRLSPNQRALVRAEKIGFVFQNFNLLARTTAVQNVTMPLDYAPRRAAEDPQQLAHQLLGRVGLADRVHHYPSQMSGGQQQRVAIARALVNHPALLLADEPTGNLDSKTSVEILEMFQRLNAEGITVVLVTHDPKVAAYAHRTIRVVDGMVESDERSEAPAVVEAPAEPPRLSTTARDDGPDTAAALPARDLDKPVSPPKKRRALASPLLPATWRAAFNSLWRHKMRSGLSALGVIIAVAAVIAMTEIGQGSKATLQKSIASMGANTLMVFSGATTTGGVNQGTGTAVTLTPDDAAEIGRQCPAVAAVAPVVRARAQIVYGNRNWIPDQIQGTTPMFLVIREWQDMALGEMFTDRDVRNGNKVCVIGDTIKRNLFAEVSPLGKEIRINNVSFRVVGVLARKGANMMGMDQDNLVLAPWTTIKYRVSGSTLTSTNQSASSSESSTSDSVNTLSNLYPTPTARYLSRTSSENANYPQPVRFTNVDQILVKAASGTNIKPAISQISQILRERHHTPKGGADDFTIRDMTEMMNMLSSTTQSMSLLLLVVALISLVVGGVGIMNIMLVSVTERTREIGLRMAVGARGHHILRQFLAEAVVLCLAGGATGIALGRGVSILVRSIIHWPTTASVGTIVAAVLVSAGVGIAFGFYPAWKGSRLDPIEALRYE